MTMTLYKVLAADRLPHYGGTGQWPPPPQWTEPVEGLLAACENGYHLCRLEQLVGWLGPEIWEAEHDGELIEETDKLVVRRARLLRRLDTWNERTALLFAADCAERVLALFKQNHPDDKRPRAAITAARAFASGEITEEELAAAWAAAGDAAGAARAAAWAAALDAERSWQTERLRQYLAAEVRT